MAPTLGFRLLAPLVGLSLAATALVGTAPATAQPDEPQQVRAASAPSISVTGSTVESTYPSYAPSTNRYGIRPTAAARTMWEAGETISVTVNLANLPAAARATVNGVPVVPGKPHEVNGLRPGDEIAVMMDEGGESTSQSWIVLPPRFPRLATTRTGPTQPGFVFLTLNSVLSDTGFNTVVDDNGVPIWVQPVTETDGVKPGNGDLKLQPNGNYSVARTAPAAAANKTGQWIVELDEQFNEVAEHHIETYKNTDFHDSVLLEDGRKLLIGYEGGGGLIHATIEEQDANGNPTFTWHSGDAGGFTKEDARVLGPLNDYAHINSVAETADGNLIASFRNLSAVLKIARHDTAEHASGDVIWQLGGKGNDFTFIDDPWGGPCAQHTAYELDNGNVLLFDNGADDVPADHWGVKQSGAFCPGPLPEGSEEDTTGRPQTRVVEYEIDEQAMTATLVWQYTDEERWSIFAGSSQRLANGNTFIGWALNNNREAVSPTASEVTPEGNEVWVLTSPGYTSYRAWRFPAPDRIAPTVTGPAAQTAAQGTSARAAFQCADRGGSNLLTCTAEGLDDNQLDTSTVGTHSYTVVARDTAGNETTTTRTYLVESRRPNVDLAARKGKKKWHGVGSTGTTKVKTKGKRTVVKLRVENTGDVATKIRVKGRKARKGVTVTYKFAGRNITKKVASGKFRTPKLEPGEKLRFKAVVKRNRKTAPRKFRIVTRTQAGPTARDRVRIIAR